MPPLRVFTYYVVHFLEKPYPDIEQYICIPNHWVRTRNPKNLTVLVSYPSQHSSRTEERVRKGSDLCSTWKQYNVEVVHGTYDVDAAKSYIEHKLDRRSRTPIEEVDGEELLRSLKIKAPTPMKPTKKRMFSTTAVEPKHEPKLQITPKTTAHSSANTEPHKKHRKSVESVEPALVNKLNDQIGNMYENLRNYKAAVSDLDSTMMYVTENVNKINKHINASCDLRDNITPASTPKQSEAQKVNSTEKHSESDDEHSSLDDEDDSDNESIEEDRSSASEVSQRGEQFNSRSTLKYHGERPGLWDLGGGVWVSKSKLENCLLKSKDQESLTKMLLELVFSKKALEEAIPAESLERAQRDPYGMDIAPKLDDHAMGVVALYARAHAFYQGWL